MVVRSSPFIEVLLDPLQHWVAGGTTVPVSCCRGGSLPAAPHLARTYHLVEYSAWSSMCSSVKPATCTILCVPHSDQYALAACAAVFTTAETDHICNCRFLKSCNVTNHQIGRCLTAMTTSCQCATARSSEQQYYWMVRYDRSIHSESVIDGCLS